MIDYSKILLANYAGKQWTLEGDTYEGLTWLDSTPKPTQATLDVQWPAVAFVLTACETTRNNAPKKGPMTRCSTITQCERVTNG